MVMANSKLINKNLRMEDFTIRLDSHISRPYTLRRE